MSLWIQRPTGQLAGLLLLVAMISAGMPAGKVHAHVDGDHAHDHAAQLADGLSDHDDAPASNPIDTTVLHAHDVGTTTASTLPTPLMLMLSARVPMAPIARLTTSPPPSSARIPPHRPPIA